MLEFSHAHICVSIEEGFEEIVSRAVSESSRDDDVISSTSEAEYSPSSFSKLHSELKYANHVGTMTSPHFDDSCAKIIADIDASTQVSDQDMLSTASDSMKNDIQEFINQADDVLLETTYLPCENVHIGCNSYLPAGFDHSKHQCNGVSVAVVNATTVDDKSVPQQLLDVQRHIAALTEMVKQLTPCQLVVEDDGRSLRMQGVVPKHQFKWGSIPETKLYVSLVVSYRGEFQTLRNIAVNSTIFELRTAIARTVSVSQKNAEFDLFVKTSGYELCLKLDDSKTVANYQPRYLYDGAEVSLMFRPKGVSMGCGLAMKSV